MQQLADKKCVPCHGGVPVLKGQELANWAAQVQGWTVVAEHEIEKNFKFPDFKSALAFVNQVGAIAEAEDHHPEIWLTWGKVKITLWTHAINGLSENDFILAAKIDRIR